MARYDSAAARAGPALTGKGSGGDTVAEAEKKVLKAAVERAKRETVRRALEQARGNVAEAASSLGILRTSLYRTMKRYGIASSSRDGR